MISENIKKYRAKNKISKEKLSRKTGISTATISRLESGEVDNPTIKTLILIAKALKTSVAQLIK